MKFNNKKGSQQMWWIIVAAVLAILVMIFIMIWFKGTGESAFESVNKKVTGLKDWDSDNVADMFDKCPCDAGVPEADYPGCPDNIDKATYETLSKRDVSKDCK